MTASVPFKPKRLSLCIAAALSAAGAGTAQAVPTLHAEAQYTINGSTTVLPSQTSNTAVDILEFTGSGGVSIGLHTFGDWASKVFGNRASGDINGTGSYDVSGLFRLTIPDAEVGSSFTFNIIPGEVSARGPDGGFLNVGDFLDAFVELDISVGGASVFHSEASALLDDDEATAGFTGNDIGFSCTNSLASGFASCSIAGGPFTLDGLGSGDLVYTLYAQARGNVTDSGQCGSGGIGNGSDFQLAFIGDGGEGGGAFCGSVARSGDPLPEPGTIGLAGLGIAALGLARRRKKT